MKIDICDQFMVLNFCHNYIIKAYPRISFRIYLKQMYESAYMRRYISRDISMNNLSYSAMKSILISLRKRINSNNYINLIIYITPQRKPKAKI